MDVINYILPYPYAAYTEFERKHSESFEQYKDKIYGWVEENSCFKNISIEQIQYMLSLTDSDEKIKKWIVDHLDRFKYINDFSGLDFGIKILEKQEKISIAFPYKIKDEDKGLYPEYDEEEFKNMDLLGKFEWMNKNCEFIPIRIIYENIDLFGIDESHKFSHIKRNTIVMSALRDYIITSKYLPNDNVYYFIRFNLKTKSYYLKRDLKLSPKK